MTTQPEPYRYTDAYGDDLYVGWHADDNDQQVLAFESQDTIHVPLADVEQVVDAIRAQARQILGTTEQPDTMTAVCGCDPAPYRESDGTYSHWAGCPVADAQQAAEAQQPTPAPAEEQPR